MQPDGLATEGAGDLEASDVPPGPPKGAGEGLREVRKVPADRVLGARNLSQVHPVIGVGIDFVVDQRRQHSRRHGGRVPASGFEFAARESFPVLLHLAGRLNEPMVLEQQPFRRGRFGRPCRVCARVEDKGGEKNNRKFQSHGE